ncbi:hypothetical protein P153DRAFT_333116, partial [Dothidotthia symphoricarpi CBS 119687]
FKRNKISLFSYLPYSPDLAPIKNVWSLLKDRLDNRIATSLGVGASKASVEAFIRAIHKE